MASLICLHTKGKQVYEQVPDKRRFRNRFSLVANRRGLYRMQFCMKIVARWMPSAHWLKANVVLLQLETCQNWAENWAKFCVSMSKIRACSPGLGFSEWKVQRRDVVKLVMSRGLWHIWDRDKTEEIRICLKSGQNIFPRPSSLRTGPFPGLHFENVLTS